MPYVSSRAIVTYALFFRDVALSVLTVVSLFLSVLWISVFLYGSFYFFYMPSQTYEIPINFRFEPCDDAVSPVGFKCSFLVANVEFSSRENPIPEFSLMPGLSYMVSLELELPPTENNQKSGMFMTCIQFNDQHGSSIQRKCMSAIVEQRSSLAQTIRTLITYPLKMFTGGRERFIVNIDFYNNFQDDVHRPTRGFFFEIQSRHIDVYDSKLKIHAHFSGLRYLMYYYPIFSSFLGASLIGVLISSVMAVAWKRFFEPTVIVKVDTFSDRQERARAALARSSSQIRVLQKVKSSQEMEETTTRMTALSELEPFVDELNGGIEISPSACRRESPFDCDVRRRRASSSDDGHSDILST